MVLGSHNSGDINRIWQYLRALKGTYYRIIKKKVVILVYSVKNYYVLKMSENKEKIQYVLEFYKKKNATQAAKKICDVYGHDAIRVAQSWFKRFQSGNFDIKDASHSGRPITEKVEEIMEKIE